MPIFDIQQNPSPEIIEPIDSKIKQKAKKEYESVLVDSSYIPQGGLKTYISGSGWNSIYYSQLLAIDDQANAGDTGSSAVVQQYKKILDFELKVQDPLTEAVSETGQFVISGSSNLYPGIRATKGDMFLADIGDGAVGLFEVIRVERSTIYRESAYSIEYTLKTHRDGLDIEVSDLDSKTVETVHFSKDGLRYGRRYLIRPEEMETREKLLTLKRDIVRSYLDEFFNHNRGIIYYPSENHYDPFIPKFFTSLLDTREHPWLVKVKHPITDSDFYIRFSTVLSAIISGSGFQSILYDEMWWESVVRKVHEPETFSLYNYSISKLAVPVPYGMSGYKQHDTYGTRSETSSEGVTEAPIAYSVNYDQKYIFSNNFYSDLEAKSVIEITVKKLLNKETYDGKTLFDIYEYVSKMSPVDRFHLYPIIIALIMYSDRNN